ncbi:MAG: MarR family transcriptional regulator [Calditrichaeota bacterium]|nr:MAG: MarR family transcriptional regulator [Calditrichota bacterium]
MNPEAVYCHRENFLEIARKLNMKVGEWKVLFAINGHRRVADLQEMFHLSSEELASILRRLEQSKLIREKEVSLEEFLREYPEALKDHPDIPALLSREQEQVSRPFRLKPVLDYIERTAGNGKIGNFAVYRVFLKISPEALKEAGITSLKNIPEDLLISSPRFKRELIAAVQKTTGREVPVELFQG